MYCSEHHLRQAEVENLGMTALGDKDIRRFDVAVDDAFRVRSVERVGNLNRQSEQNLRLHGSPGDAMLQRQAVQKLHDDERMAVLLPDLVDRADIGMVQRRGRLRLPLEAGQGLGVFGDVIGQELQGDKAVEGYVLGLVDHTHPAATQLLDDAVVRDGLADHSGHDARLSGRFILRTRQRESTNDGVVYGDGKSATPHFPHELGPLGAGARARAGRVGGAAHRSFADNSQRV